MLCMEIMQELIADQKDFRPRGYEGTCMFLYAGIVNECKLERKAPPTYRQVCEWVELAFESEQGQREIYDALEVFTNSKWGSQLVEFGKKKIAEEKSQSEQTTHP